MLLNDEVFQNGGSPWQDEGLFNEYYLTDKQNP